MEKPRGQEDNKPSKRIKYLLDDKAALALILEVIPNAQLTEEERNTLSKLLQYMSFKIQNYAENLADAKLLIDGEKLFSEAKDLMIEANDMKYKQDWSIETLLKDALDKKNQ